MGACISCTPSPQECCEMAIDRDDFLWLSDLLEENRDLARGPTTVSRAAHLVFSDGCRPAASPSTSLGADAKRARRQFPSTSKAKYSDDRVLLRHCVEGETLLHYAVAKDAFRCVWVLCDVGGLELLRCCDAKGLLPIHYAVRRRYLAPLLTMVQYLHDHPDATLLVWQLLLVPMAPSRPRVAAAVLDHRVDGLALALSETTPASPISSGIGTRSPGIGFVGGSLRRHADISKVMDDTSSAIGPETIGTYIRRVFARPALARALTANRLTEVERRLQPKAAGGADRSGIEQVQRTLGLHEGPSGLVDIDVRSVHTASPLQRRSDWVDPIEPFAGHGSGTTVGEASGSGSPPVLPASATSREPQFPTFVGPNPDDVLLSIFLDDTDLAVAVPFDISLYCASAHRVRDILTAHRRARQHQHRSGPSKDPKAATAAGKDAAAPSKKPASSSSSGLSPALNAASPSAPGQNVPPPQDPSSDDTAGDTTVDTVSATPRRKRHFVDGPDSESGDEDEGETEEGPSPDGSKQHISTRNLPPLLPPQGVPVNPQFFGAYVALLVEQAEFILRVAGQHVVPSAIARIVGTGSGLPDLVQHALHSMQLAPSHNRRGAAATRVANESHLSLGSGSVFGTQPTHPSTYCYMGTEASVLAVSPRCVSTHLLLHQLQDPSTPALDTVATGNPNLSNFLRHPEHAELTAVLAQPDGPLIGDLGASSVRSGAARTPPAAAPDSGGTRGPMRPRTFATFGNATAARPLRYCGLTAPSVAASRVDEARARPSPVPTPTGQQHASPLLVGLDSVKSPMSVGLICPRAASDVAQLRALPGGPGSVLLLTPFLAGIYGGHLTVVRRLLVLGGLKQLHVCDSRGNTVLHHCAGNWRRFGDRTMFDFFVNLFDAVRTQATRTNDDALRPGELNDVVVTSVSPVRRTLNRRTPQSVSLSAVSSSRIFDSTDVGLTPPPGPCITPPRSSRVLSRPRSVGPPAVMPVALSGLLSNLDRVEATEAAV